MRENRTHGSEGGESGSTGLPYPYRILFKMGIFGKIHYDQNLAATLRTGRDRA